jgi:hypothetical protein
MAVSDLDAKLSQLYREVSTQGPPPALDALILAAAQQQVAMPKRRERPWWSRWMAPASLMATIVIGLSLTLSIVNDHPETVDGDVVRQSSAPSRAVESAKAKFADDVPAESVARKGAPAVALSGPAPQVAAKSALTQAPPTSAETKSESSLAAQPAPLAEGRIITPSAADAVQAEPHLKGGGFGVMREANVTRETAVGASASVPAAPSAAKAAPMHSQASPRPPEAWLDDIRRLIREGRENEADAQLAEFRKAYPRVTVPADLKR